MSSNPSIDFPRVDFSDWVPFKPTLSPYQAGLVLSYLPEIKALFELDPHLDHSPFGYFTIACELQLYFTNPNLLKGENDPLMLRTSIQRVVAQLRS